MQEFAIPGEGKVERADTWTPGKRNRLAEVLPAEIIRNNQTRMDFRVVFPQMM
jgi:hypothetical protein